MTAHRLVNRRLLLTDMGKAGLAVMVFGAAACSEEPTDNATPTDEPGTTSVAGTPTTSSPTTAPTDSTSSTSAPVSAQHDWHRVDLGFVSAYILYRNGEATVVDTGVDGSAMSIESGLAEVGLGWGDVSGLVITHRHPDHQGSVEGVLSNTPAQTPWFAGAADLDAITAPHAGQAVGDGDMVNGLEIIESPGHTAGHICVLDASSGILVAGDALNGENGGVAGPNPGFSDDIELANASVAKLVGFDYEVVLFGHGDPVLEAGSTAVADLAATLG
jgi:glyoxylase-like metal-dependent hydrolase (beta-lactamase superfamily II)